MLIHCRLNDINIIILLSKFDKILKINVKNFVLKFGTCNVI